MSDNDLHDDPDLDRRLARYNTAMTLAEWLEERFVDPEGGYRTIYGFSVWSLTPCIILSLVYPFIALAELWFAITGVGELLPHHSVVIRVAFASAIVFLNIGLQMAFFNFRGGFRFWMLLLLIVPGTAQVSMDAPGIYRDVGLITFVQDKQEDIRRKTELFVREMLQKLDQAEVGMQAEIDRRKKTLDEEENYSYRIQLLQRQQTHLDSDRDDYDAEFERRNVDIRVLVDEQRTAEHAIEEDVRSRARFLGEVRGKLALLAPVPGVRVSLPRAYEGRTIVQQVVRTTEILDLQTLAVEANAAMVAAAAAYNAGAGEDVEDVEPPFVEVRYRNTTALLAEGLAALDLEAWLSLLYGCLLAVLAPLVAYPMGLAQRIARRRGSQAGV